MAWREYFERHLGWRPWIFAQLLDGKHTEITVLTDLPQQFDPEFMPDLEWQRDHHIVPRAAAA